MPIFVVNLTQLAMNVLEMPSASSKTKYGVFFYFFFTWLTACNSTVFIAKSKGLLFPKHCARFLRLEMNKMVLALKGFPSLSN